MRVGLKENGRDFVSAGESVCSPSTVAGAMEMESIARAPVRLGRACEIFHEQLDPPGTVDSFGLLFAGK